MAQAPAQSVHSDPSRSWANGVSLGMVVSLFRRRPVFIVIWVVLGMTAIVFGVFQLTPAYQATAEVALDSRLRRPDDFAAVVSGPFTLTDYVPIVRSELQVLGSPALASRVIDELHLDQAREFQGGNGLRARIGALASDVVERMLPEWLNWAVLPPTPPPSAEVRRIMLLEEYARRVSVSNDGRSLTILVKAWANDPALATAIANTHVSLYVQDQIALKDASAKHALAWIGQQLDRLRQDLKSKEDELRIYREGKGLVLAMGSTLIAQQAAQINDRLSQARTELAQKRAMAAQLKQGGAGAADIQSPVLASRLVQQLRGQEAELNSQLQKVRSRYADDGPVVQSIESQIAGVRRDIARETARIAISLTADADVAEARVNDLSIQLDVLRKQLATEDHSDVRVAEIQRDITTRSGVYQELMSRQQQIAAQIGASQPDARVIAPAMLPRLPFYPKIALFLLLGLVGTTLSGLGGAFLLERMRKGVDDLNDIPNARTIRHLHPIPNVQRSQHLGSLPDHLLRAPLGAFADSIRSLRGDVMHSAVMPVPRVIALTSALPGEGKTTMAVSIARSMAVAGLQVLLIDCDLRRPRCAEMVGTRAGAEGLIRTLTGRAPVAGATIADPKSSLKLLVPEVMTTSPQDLLGPALNRVICEAQGQFDIIILDTPPVAAVADAFLVTQLADTVALAVRWRVTPAKVVDQAIAGFQERRIPLSGVFLNGINPKQIAANNGQKGIYKMVKTYYPAA